MDALAQTAGAVDAPDLFRSERRCFDLNPPAAVTLAGGAAYLLGHGMQEVDYRVIQLGVVLLLATPITRVALSALAFARQRDRIYVLVTRLVLAVLLASVLIG